MSRSFFSLPSAGRIVALAAPAVLALAGCAVAPPSGPQVVAMPGSGKTYEQFIGEDSVCRQTAAIQAGPAPSAQASTNATLGSAAIGTGLGAAAGAAIGSAAGSVGGGAAVGGALGLLAGTSVGASNAQAAAGNLQAQYDITYAQCMTAKGNTIQNPPPPAYGGDVVIYGGYPAVVPYGYYPYPYPYPYHRRFYYGY